MGKIAVYNATDAPITTADGVVVGGRERANVDESAAGTPGLVNVTAANAKKTEKTSSSSTPTKASSTRKSASKGADDSQED